jgi:hypothetical protein
MHPQPGCHAGALQYRLSQRGLILDIANGWGDHNEHVVRASAPNIHDLTKRIAQRRRVDDGEQASFSKH